ncbi:LamG domain-containing protein [Candidatus Omnitrophota bacterium]
MNIKRVILIMILIIALVPVTTYAASKGKGPVAHWRFNEAGGDTAYDEGWTDTDSDGVKDSGESWNDNDGTLDADDVGGGSNVAVGHMWYPQGKISGCLEFDGTDDYVEVSDSPSISITGDISIGAWIKLEQLPSTAAADFMIVTKWGASADTEQDYFFFVDESEGDKLVLRFTDNGAWTSGHYSYFECNTSFDADDVGKWIHVAVTADVSVPSAAFYIDGAIQTDTEEYTQSTSIHDSAAPLEIGTLRTDSVPTFTKFFDGLIDDVKIYDYARTAEEIMVDYNAGEAAYLGAGTDPNEGNPPVGWWQFDEGEGSGANAYDRSGSNHNGTITNATWGRGKYGNALSFDGDGDYVGCGTTLLNNPTAGAVSMWIKPSADGVSNATKLYWNTTILMKGIVYAAIQQLSDNKIRMYYWDGVAWRNLDSLSSVALNQWNHIAYTWSSSGSTIYINGSKDNYSSIRTWSDIQAGHLNQLVKLGGEVIESTPYYFSGLIDDLKIYDYARTQAEIAYDYNKGKPVAHWKFDEGGGPIAHDEYSTAGSGAVAPVGWWRMDEGSWNGTANEVVDSSGNGNNGVRAGNATTSSSSKIGPYCGTFDGTGDYVNIGTGTGLNPNYITLEAWVKWDGTAGEGEIIGRWGDGGITENAYVLGVNSGSKLFVKIVNSTPTEVNVADTVNLTTGWTHVAATYDGINIRLYKNGVQVNSGSQTGNINSVSELVYLGAIAYTSLVEWDGLIDDVRIYDYARTAAQIAEDYKTTHGTLVADTKFVDGKIGKSLTFDGTDDYVDLGDTSGFPNGPSARTVAFWTLLQDNSASDDYFMSWGHATTGGAFFAPRINSSGNISLMVNSGGSYDDINSSTSRSSIYNVWSHLAYTYDGSTTAKIYLNGALIYTGSTGAVLDTLTGYDAYIGARNNSGYNNGINADIDDVKIYNYVRTADQVMQDYNDGVSAYLGPPATYEIDPWGGAAPVGWWQMDEYSGKLAHDNSGNGNDGTLTNMDEADWVLGKHGSGLDFDGSNDYVDCGNDSVFNFTTQFTVEAWIKPSDVSDYRRIVSKFESPDLPWIFTIDSSGVLNLQVRPNVSTRASSVTISTTEWTHVVGVYDGGASRLDVYINGVLNNGTLTNAVPASLNVDDSHVYIGSAVTSPYPMLGKIDDVRLYNYTRTQAQIAWDYNRGKPVGHWKMDEATSGAVPTTAGAIKDDSDNDNDGTASNTTWTYTTGKFGGALTFDGNDYVSVTHDATLALWDRLTIAFWVYVDTSANDGILAYVVSKNDGGSDGYGVYWEDRGGQDGFRIVLSGTSPLNITGLSTGWHHIAFSWDKDLNSGAIYEYADGELRASSTTRTSSLTTNTRPVTIGCEADATNFYDGQMDDVRIYNYSRTADQVMQDYNAGLATKLGD